MKHLLLFIILIAISFSGNSQSVGIGTITPSHYFHVVPPTGTGDPIRIEGLQGYSAETDVLVVDPTTGVIRYMPLGSILLGNDTIFFNDTSYTLIRDSLLTDSNFLDSLILVIADSIDTDIDSMTFANDTLYLYEDNQILKTYLNPSLDTNLVDSLIINQSDTLYSIISDSALNDTLWIKQLDSLLNIYGDTIFFNDSSYTIIRDSLLKDSVFLDSLIGLLRDSINTDDQNIDSVTINGTILTVYIEDGTSANVNIVNSVDSLIFDKSDSLYTYITDSSLNDTMWVKKLDSLLGIYGDTIYFNDTSYTLTRDSLLQDSLFIDSLISLIGDSINTDDQNIDSVTLNGTIINVYIEDGTSASVDLQPIIDSAINNTPAGSDDQDLTLSPGTATTSIIDIESSTSNITIREGLGIQLTEAGNTLTITGDQDIDSVTLNGTDLTVYIENGASSLVDLQPIIDSAIANTPAGSDDQNIDSVTLNGTDLEVYIENGSSSLVDLQPIIDSAIANTPAGSDDQNIDSVTLNGTDLAVYIENGTSSLVDLQPIIDSAIANASSGTDDQNLTSATLSGTTLTINIENGNPVNVNLQPIIDSALANQDTTDNDWDVNPNGTGLEGNPGTNVASGTNAVAAGDGNTASGNYATAFGQNNNATGLASSVFGRDNDATGLVSTISGGSNNNSTNQGTVIGGGAANNATGSYSTIAGGRNNRASNTNTIVAGGWRNQASGLSSSVVGGEDDTATGDFSFLGGGEQNDANGTYSTVAGGSLNRTTGDYSVISGGSGNRTIGNYSVVSGGRRDTAYSYGEWIGGLYSTGYAANSTTAFNANDRLFVVGNGTSAAARSNALTLFKNGSLEINEEYTLPNTDGTANQVLQTDGAGNVSWANSTGGADNWGSQVVITSGANIAGNGTAGSPLSVTGDGTGTDDQNLTSATLLGTTLTVDIENGNPVNVNLQPIVDSAVANSSGGADSDWNINGNGTGLEGNPGTNVASGTNSIAAGQSIASGNYAVAFGQGSEATGLWSGVTSGLSDTASGQNAFVGGGSGNHASGSNSTITGGANNKVTSNFGTVTGGSQNIVTSVFSTINGGNNNSVSGQFSTIGGGFNNIASNQFTFVGGGEDNTASGNNSLIIAGDDNTASGVFSSIIGGLENEATGNNSLILGGQFNQANGDYSLTFGLRDTANGANSITLGHGLTSPSYGEVALGYYNTKYTPVSPGVANPNDRLLVVGNGALATPSNGLVLYKDGSLEINEEYTLPNTDGTANQVLRTDGAGNVSWRTILSGGTDDQRIDNFSLSGTTLSLEVENDGQPAQTINLQPIIDSATNCQEMYLQISELINVSSDLYIPENAEVISVFGGVNVTSVPSSTYNFEVIDAISSTSLYNNDIPGGTNNIAISPPPAPFDNTLAGAVYRLSVNGPTGSVGQPSRWGGTIKLKVCN